MLTVPSPPAAMIVSKPSATASRASGATNPGAGLTRSSDPGIRDAALRIRSMEEPRPAAGFRMTQVRMIP